jgi:hypothetical protein
MTIYSAETETLALFRSFEVLYDYTNLKFYYGNSFMKVENNDLVKRPKYCGLLAVTSRSM